MPLYDFECRKCSHIFEAFLRLSEGTDELPCPKCGAGNPRKLISACRTNAWSSFLDNLERKVSPEKFK
jgi:putative FmdB family regulatory protein